MVRECELIAGRKAVSSVKDAIRRGRDEGREREAAGRLGRLQSAPCAAVRRMTPDRAFPTASLRLSAIRGRSQLAGEVQAVGDKEQIAVAQQTPGPLSASGRSDSAHCWGDVIKVRAGWRGG